jgi:hypothetical protein
MLGKRFAGHFGLVSGALSAWPLLSFAPGHSSIPHKR